MSLAMTVPRTETPTAATAPSWSTPREAIHVVFLRSTMRKTTRIALVVGTLLSVINQGYLIWGGRATAVTWIRVGANYLVPFCVSSTGFLTATKRSAA
jgi:hypothetical protein